MRNDIECPYCKKDIEICHDDGQGYEEGVAHKQECRECEKTFVFYTSTHHSYNPRTADCLNGSEHKWEPLCSTLKGRERCSDCDEERIADKELYEKSLRGEV